MSTSDDVSSALDAGSRASYTAQLRPEQIRWLQAQADRHDTTVDRFLRAILTQAIDAPSDPTPSSDPSTGESADAEEETVFSRLLQAERTLRALHSGDEREPETAPSDSTGDEDSPSSMFDLAEKTL